MHPSVLGAHDPAPFAARRARLRARLGDRVALIPAGSAASRNYPANRHPFRASSHFLHLVGLPLEGAMLLTRPEGDRLLLPPLAEDHALWHGPAASAAAIRERTGLLVCSLESLEDELGGRDLGVLASTCPRTRDRLAALLERPLGVDAHVESDLVLADAMIEERLAHDDLAVAELRRAARATVSAHRAGMAATRPGLRAHAIRAAMEGALLELGMGTAYGSIVTPHGEILHDESHHHVISREDLVLADVGAESPLGYAGDVTRTWPASGRFGGRARALYSVVLEAQTRAIARARPGVRFRDLHLGACRTLAEGLVDLGLLRGDVDGLVEDGVHALFFPHGLGHLLGLDVHDMEDLGDRAGYAAGRRRSEAFGLGNLRLDRDLAPGMAVTIEPGLYFVPAILDDPARRAAVGDRVDWERVEAFRRVRGIRIEDDVVVTDAGVEVLTLALPKAPEAVEALVGSAS